MNVSSEASQILFSKTTELAKTYGLPFDKIKTPIVEIIEVTGVNLLGNSIEKIPVTGSEMSRIIAEADLSQESINDAISLIAKKRAKIHHHHISCRGLI